MISRIKLHKSGPEFSRLVYGVWRLSEDKAGTDKATVQKKIEYCLENGITTFDHADIYGGYSCEEIFGQVLKSEKTFAKKIEIVTKCGIMLVTPSRPQNRIKHYDTMEKHILASVEKSLQNLGVEKIDLLLIHRPSPILNPEEVGSAFGKLKSSGKVLHFGVSNFLPHQFQSLQSYLDFPLSTNQVEISPLTTTPYQNGILDQALEKRFSPMAWSPFAGGNLFLQKDSKSKSVMQVVERLAKEKGFTVEEIILKWITFSSHNIVPVIGTNQISRITNCLRFAEVNLTNEEWFEIYSASIGTEVP